MQRIILAVKKIWFCLSVSRNLRTAFRLMRNTKLEERSTESLYKMNIDDTDVEIYLRTGTGDISIFYDIFWRKIYSLPIAVLDNAKVIVDLGAHIGMASLYFSLKTDAVIYAVEADPDNFKLLEKNAGDKTMPFNAAIHYENTAWLKRKELSYNTVVSDEETGIQVEGIDINGLIAKYHIDFIDILKIDIEGSEKTLFKGNCDWLSKVGFLVVELHNTETEKLFAATVRQYGFSIDKQKLANENIYFAYKA